MTTHKVKRFRRKLPSAGDIMLYFYLCIAIASFFAIAGGNVVPMVAFLRLHFRYPAEAEPTAAPKTIGSAKEAHHTEEHFPTATFDAEAQSAAAANVPDASAAPAVSKPTMSHASVIPLLSLDAIVDFKPKV